ncbi:MAG TPA: HAD family phosphatase [Terriglobales bacterium]|nr:HAD family phosphatase [Terriglobales bacterium]
MSKIDLSGISYRALIFDCDGTLADTAPFHFRSLQEAFRKQGLPIEESWYRERVGLSRTPLLRAYEQQFGIRIDWAATEVDSEQSFAELIHEVREFPLVASIAREHRGRVPMAVASGGQRSLVEPTLRACGLFDLFDAVVTIDDVEEGKPSPALYLEAARRLQVPPELCLVFEDSDEGLEGARKANMNRIDVRQYLLAPE